MSECLLIFDETAEKARCEMFKYTGLLTLTLADWWARIVGAAVFLITLFGGWRAFLAYRADKLTAAQAEVKALRADVARLLREATVRIDNEQDYLTQIDGLQRQVSDQRTRISDLLNGRPTQDS